MLAAPILLLLCNLLAIFFGVLVHCFFPESVWDFLLLPKNTLVCGSFLCKAHRVGFDAMIAILLMATVSLLLWFSARQAFGHKKTRS
ncbi:hypothetical protein BAE30_00040 [Acidithiobacillus caldus]|uniref:Uncharacterized protein n=1 Tax=Acidithiobacillus caldus TaxID=33059 RepID=A0A1E7Z4P7_9PROT|nr:hypothetical protein BAE30_00040 [Acidithiobacillus caldus]